MSMFSAIDAEAHLKVVDEAIKKAKKEMRKRYPLADGGGGLRRRQKSVELTIVDEALKIVHKYCHKNIFE